MSTVQSVDRTFAILECFEPAHPSRSVGDIAQITGLARPTIYRLLQTLTGLGYVEHTHGRYQLAPRVLRFAAAYAGPPGLAGQAQPVLDRLAARLSEHVALAVLDGDEVITIAVSNTARSRLLAIAVQVGQRLSAVDTSLGRVLLAHRPGDDGPLDPDVGADIRKRGFAVADGLIETGLLSIGVPVRARGGAVIAALAVAVNAARVDLAELERDHLPAMLAAAAELTAPS